jgi:hypothetical protein
MRTSLMFVSLLAVTLAAPLAAQEAGGYGRAIQFGPQITWGDGFGIGAGARVNYPSVGRMVGVRGLGAYAAFDYHFPEAGNVWELNANATYEVAIRSMPKLAPYVGGGLSYVKWTSGGGDLGFNALAGARFTVASKYRMYAEARMAFHESAHLNLTAGVLF